ncbi:MAG: Lrp/AsnC family transcriptional regulator [Caldilineaceae bacterium]
MASKLDPTDHRLLDLLRDDARLSYAELGRQVGLTAPAVAERMRRLEDQGVILGYRAVTAQPEDEAGVLVFVLCVVAAERYPSFVRLVRELPTVQECHHVTGDTSFVLKIRLDAIGALDPILAQLGRFGATRTMVVLSTAVDRCS